MNNKKWTWLAVAMLAALAPAVAFAGYKSAKLVSCTGNVANGSCEGMLLAVHNSSDNDQEISCETRARKGVVNRDVF